MTKRIVLAVIGGAALAVGASYALARRQATPPPRSASDFPRCSPAAQGQCVVDVYEDRRGGRGRTLAINVVILRARVQALAPPIFWLDGGPGGSATSAIGPASEQYFRDLRDDRDLVFVDQRGTGGSNPLHCDNIGEAQDRLDTFFGPLFPPELVRACRQTLEQQADLKLYTTSLAMDDMDDVRAALGYPQIDLAGASYGTISAQVYVRQHPGRVRAMFLAGVATPAFKLPLPFARATQAAWERVVKDCAADASCQKAFPDLQTKLDSILARFDHGPIHVQMRDPATGSDRAVTLHREAFVERIRAMLYGTGGARMVPLVVHRASLGDFHSFQAMANRFRLGGAAARGAYFSMTCSESVPFITEEEIVAETRNTFLGDRRTRAHVEACRQWVRGDVPLSYLEPIRTDVSTVLFSGDVDGATPPWVADQAITNFAKGRLVRAVNTGHQLSGTCTWGLMHAFFRNPVVQELDASCVTNLRRPAFALELN